jgi:ABC-type lipoprotein export system ATPase subunit
MATLVVATHNPEVAEAADRIIYMRDGAVERSTASRV